MGHRPWVAGFLLSVAVSVGSPALGQLDGGLVDDFLILQVRLRGHVLAKAMPALVQGGELFLPLGEFAGALEFPIQVDPEAGTASGWALEEDRTFTLDTGPASVVLAGERTVYDPVQVMWEPDGLYIAAGLLEEWFPLSLTLDLSSLQVTVESHLPLPVERRLEREKRRARALASRQALDRIEYPTAGNVYEWASWPFVDLSLSGERRRDRGGERSWEGDFSVLATADVLRMTGEVFAGGDDREGVDEFSARLGRRDPEGRVAGPLRATEVMLGDLYSPPVPLVSGSVRGRGATLSSFPLDRPDEFDRTDIRGVAPPRWEAELYRAGSLLAFQIVDGDGVYEFLQVPLLYGRNEFAVVLYGPQGQERRIPYRFYVGPGLTEPGRVFYRASLSQDEEAVFPVVPDDSLGVSTAGEWRGGADLEWGVAPNLSLAMVATTLPIVKSGGKERHNYLGLGGRFTAAGLFATLEGVQDVGGGSALHGKVQTRWSDANWFAEHARFWEFESERVENGDPVVTRTDARVEWGSSLLVPFSVGLEVGHESRRSGRSQGVLGNRLSVSLGRVLATNRMEWRRAGEQPDRITGEFLLSTLSNGVSLRGGLGYRVQPETELGNASLTLDWRPAGFGRFSFQWSHSFSGADSTYGVSWSQSFPVAAMGLTGSYTDGGSYSAGGSTSFSLGRDPGSGDWEMRGEAMAAKGAVSLRVVLDQNGNGRVDPGDVPLEGVRPMVNGRAIQEVATDAAGVAFLPCLPAHRWVDISVDEGSLEDPFWIVRPGGQRVLPRPGAAPMLEFLVVETGEIEGTVYMRMDTEVRRQPRVKVQLLDPEGEVVQEVESEFDGFFLFQKVPLGDYAVQVSPEQLRGAVLTSGGAQDVRLTDDQMVVVGTDFILVEREER